MANLNDVLKDPDFWGPETSDDDRKWTLSQVDKKFAAYGEEEKTRFLSNLSATRAKQKAEGEAEKAARQAEIVPKIQAQQTKWEQMVAPATQAVGRGVEMATSPLVGLSRMVKGEGAGAAFGPETFTASHPSTAGQVASNIVPQSPWQAGAMAGALVPGAAGMGAAARIGGAAIGGGGLQGLLGAEGLLEGNTNVAGEAISGGLKGAATQGAGEALGKMIGGTGRVVRGRDRVIQRGDAKNMQKAASEIAPEFAGAGKTPQEMGKFYTGTKGAEQAAAGKFKQGMDALEKTLVKETGQPYIDTPGLRLVYSQLRDASRKEPLISQQIVKLNPGPGGFLPSQAAEIVALARQNLHIQPSAMGKVKQTGLDELVEAIEQSLPAAAKGMFSGTRDKFAKAKGIQELLEPAFSPGRHGYNVDIDKVQKALSTTPELANRFAPGELEKLFMAATRGASKGPGFADRSAAGAVYSTPSVPSKSAAMFAALRNFLRRGRHVGELPGTLPQGAKGGLGVAATATAGQRRKED